MAPRCSSPFTAAAAALSWWSQDRLSPGGGADYTISYRVNDGQPVQLPAGSPSFGTGVAFTGDIVRLLQSLPEEGHIAVRIAARSGEVSMKPVSGFATQGLPTTWPQRIRPQPVIQPGRSRGQPVEGHLLEGNKVVQPDLDLRQSGVLDLLLDMGRDRGSGLEAGQHDTGHDAPPLGEQGRSITCALLAPPSFVRPQLNLFAGNPDQAPPLLHGILTSLDAQKADNG